MKNSCCGLVFLLFSTIAMYSHAQIKGSINAIYSGISWFDNLGKVVSAHGGCIVKEKGKYYFFGEKHIDSSNAFVGFNCYSSSDLKNWKFEKIALPVQANGILGPNRVGERPKVLKCPKTGEFVMLMHMDDLTYKDQSIGYATSKTITGPYVFRGQLLFNGKPIKKWDMGSFQDTDGTGYLLTHGGVAYKLSDDYHSATENTVDNKWPGAESPAVFKRKGIYYWLTSHLSSWERNDNYYYTATSMKGPWVSQGLFAPENSLTWNSQTTFVLPIVGAKDTTFMFMGDRWSFPLQASSATYVWQPITFKENKLSIPDYLESWNVSVNNDGKLLMKTANKVIHCNDQDLIQYTGNWQTYMPTDVHPSFISNEKNGSFSVKFIGSQIGFYGIAGPKGGYAEVVIQNKKGNVILTNLIDMYCKFPDVTLKFLSPKLTKGNYTLTVTVLGKHSKWSDKRKTDYGSTGDEIALNQIVVLNN